MLTSALFHFFQHHVYCIIKSRLLENLKILEHVISFPRYFIENGPYYVELNFLKIFTKICEKYDPEWVPNSKTLNLLLFPRPSKKGTLHGI